MLRPFRLSLAAVCALAAACGHPAAPVDEGPVVARVDGEEIRLVDLDGFIKEELFEQEVGSKPASTQHEVREQALERLVESRLLEREAERRGVDVEGLLRSEAEALGPVGDEEVAAFFEENRARLPDDATLEDWTPRIRRHLESRREHEARAALVAGAEVEVLLEPPRVAVQPVGPSLGPDDAPVTIVAFSDYQCPFCKRAEPVMEQLLERYPEELRLVYRNLPLETIHPRARAAAEASVCAAEQGRFHVYHATLFENQRALSDEDLLRYAESAGLDAGAFRACREREDVKALVQRDVDAARAVGINGTPAFFVNGIPLSGARPLDDFVRVIDGELARR
jgi:protein-disulfide isomerase